jgi:outer membrane lipoprotein-sorting protein
MAVKARMGRASLRRARHGVVSLLAVAFLFPVDCRGAERIDEVIAAILQNYESVVDYQCRLNVRSYLGIKREERIINFYFKKPKLIRMDILKGTRPGDSGSIGVYKGGDKVTGRQGGLLSGIVIKVSKENPLVTTIRGVGLHESDLETVFAQLAFYEAKGRIDFRDAGSSYVFTCTALNPAENEGISKDLVWIDSRNLLITKNERYEGDRLVQAASWGEYIVNAGLPEELFDVKFDVGALGVRGIPILSQKAD